ncbi:RxLR effector family protein [Phytophthora palmivora]|uniref:RxLR effector family protein n=1 Tax=Phytophthora palmivora TaxID=4796 RepID=A0A2P4WYP0_9STRA|nr:RxLR effector family protein [Phytophthora palmivora]
MGLHDFFALAIIFVIVQVDASVATSKLLNGFPHLNTTSKAGVSATRYLTTSSGVNDNDEKRAGFSTRIIENIKSKFSSSQVSEEQLQKWLKKSTSADTVFKRLDLTKAGDELFSNTQFARWIQYVDDLNGQTRKEAVSAISKLTSEYGDDLSMAMTVCSE